MAVPARQQHKNGRRTGGAAGPRPGTARGRAGPVGQRRRLEGEHKAAEEEDDEANGEDVDHGSRNLPSARAAAPTLLRCTSLLMLRREICRANQTTWIQVDLCCVGPTGVPISELGRRSKSLCE